MDQGHAQEMSSIPDPSSNDEGIWSSLWSDIKNASIKTENRCLLILAPSTHLHRQIITKLESLSTKEPSTLLTTRRSKQSETEAHDLKLGLGYTYIQLPATGFDANPEMLDIYTFTYTDIKNSRLIESFLSRFKQKQDITIMNVIDLQECTPLSEGFSARKVFENEVQMSQLLTKIFSSEKRESVLKDQFKSCSLLYSDVPNSLVDLSALEMSKGECDCPIGVDYILAVMGSEALISQSMMSITQLEIDLLQQLLRLAVLKVGGSLFHFPGVYEDATKMKASLSGLRTYFTNKNSKLNPQVDDVAHLLIPKGWDTWGKIQVLNEKFDANYWNSQWEQARINSSESLDEDKPDTAETSIMANSCYNDYQKFLGEQYKAQMERDLEAKYSPVKHLNSPKQEYANSTILNDEPDVSIASFQETHSMLQDFRAQFLENDADLLSGMQSTPGAPRMQDTLAPGSNAAKFKDFFSLLATED